MSLIYVGHFLLLLFVGVDNDVRRPVSSHRKLFVSFYGFSPA
jgi:hypothetical protein